MSLKVELIQRLEALEARINKMPRGYTSSQGRVGGLFCLALAYRRHAIKPVERISARIHWAKMAAEVLDRIDALGNQPSTATEDLPRRVYRGR